MGICRLSFGIAGLLCNVAIGLNEMPNTLGITTPDSGTPIHSGQDTDGSKHFSLAFLEALIGGADGPELREVGAEIQPSVNGEPPGNYFKPLNIE